MGNSVCKGGGGGGGHGNLVHNVYLVLFAEQCRRIDRKMVNVKLGEELGENQTLGGERKCFIEIEGDSNATFVFEGNG